MKGAVLALAVICLSAPVPAQERDGSMTGLLDGAPASWRIDAERSEYHFESDDVGSLRIFAEPQEAPTDIGPIRLMVMMVEGTASLVELRIEDGAGNPVLGLADDAGARMVLDIDGEGDGSLRFNGEIEAQLVAYSMSGAAPDRLRLLVLEVAGGRIAATGH